MSTTVHHLILPRRHKLLLGRPSLTPLLDLHHIHQLRLLPPHGHLLDMCARHHRRLQRLCRPQPFTLQQVLTLQMEDCDFLLSLLGRQLHIQSLLWRMPEMYYEGCQSRTIILATTTVLVDQPNMTLEIPRVSGDHDEARALNTPAIPQRRSTSILLSLSHILLNVSNAWR
jgi:hypothetical protein